MKFDVMLRFGSTGLCLPAQALTFTNGRLLSDAHVIVDAQIVLPNNGLVVCIPPRSPSADVWQLLMAGYAVQFRDAALPATSPASPAAEDVDDPEDIELA